MLISKEINIKWSKKNKKYYESKGYKFSNYEEYFLVNIKDVQLNVREKVEVKCDYCNKNFEKYYQDYNNQNKNSIIKKDCCKECMPLKLKESNLLKYGVENLMQLKEFEEKCSKSKRKDISIIKQEFNKKQLKLLTYEYINSQQSLEFICKFHEDKGIQSTSWASFSQGCGCKYCTNEKRGKARRIPYEKVKAKLREKDLILLDDFYINNTSPMNVLCLKHKEFGIQQINWKTFSKVKKCKYCSWDKLAEERKFSIDFVKEQFTEKGYVMLDNDYINADTLIKYKCLKHNDNIQTITFGNLMSEHGCKFCAIENNSRENNWRWNGGITSIGNYLRNCTIEWKKESMKNCEYKCIITGERFDEIHHLYSFNKILFDVFNETKLPILESVIDYSENELQLLKDKCIEIHKRYPLGVCLKKEIHELYHSIYGDDNTPQQFYDFIRLNYSDTVTYINNWSMI